MHSQKLQEAIDFALTKHQGQVDKAGRPYFGHVLRVALSVLPYGEEYTIAALLHDVVEDCNITLVEIEQKWGSHVSEAVNALSRRPNEIYSDFVERASKNVISRVVKLADLEDNMQPERIAVLPVEQQGIIQRYAKAYEFLQTAASESHTKGR